MRLASVGFVGARCRRLFADRGVAGQALKQVEMRAVVPRLPGLHGDAADRAMAERGARAWFQGPVRCGKYKKSSSAKSAGRKLIQINCIALTIQAPGSRRGACPGGGRTAPGPAALSDLSQCAAGTPAAQIQHVAFYFQRAGRSRYRTGCHRQRRAARPCLSVPADPGRVDECADQRAAGRAPDPLAGLGYGSGAGKG